MRERGRKIGADVAIGCNDNGSYLYFKNPDFKQSPIGFLHCSGA